MYSICEAWSLPKVRVLSGPQSIHRVAMVTFCSIFSIMMEKSAQPGEGAGCPLTSFHYIYHHVQSCGVCSSWEDRYTTPTSTLLLYVLCGPAIWIGKAHLPVVVNYRWTASSCFKFVQSKWLYSDWLIKYSGIIMLRHLTEGPHKPTLANQSCLN